MRDNILLAEQLGEPEKLGWTHLGPVHREDCWQGVGWIYCKDNQFALFNECLADIEFRGFLEKRAALEDLFHYDGNSPDRLSITEIKQRGVYELVFSRLMVGTERGGIPGESFEASGLWDELEKVYLKWAQDFKIVEPYTHPNSPGSNSTIRKVDYENYL